MAGRDGASGNRNMVLSIDRCGLDHCFELVCEMYVVQMPCPSSGQYVDDLDVRFVYGTVF